ncbi:alkaline phosphatase D family protein [Gordonia jinhuaensis]|uniref:Phosphodiesterase/alkaline phosphatase D n=1 Tax=Gordonia jinhuaensis TaxID=1517702 RepID=A0A916WZP3_9ACTN|nr:alkaline phosphatase D family protein [Gordonia jinhuaensis]GGB45993.1 phosphodiesterase/alkaline phosphatase D [Gordonia jinhuaensis]
MATTPEQSISRRRVLAAGAITVATATVADGLTQTFAGRAQATPAARAFVHGVASGDPLPDAVLIWTRITPSVQATPGSGRGAPARLRWEVATDPGFAHVVRSGVVTTTAARDHTVTVDVTGLSPATVYLYRFTSLDGPTSGQVSPIGRTKTAPAHGTDLRALNLAFVCCSNYEAGYFTAYRRLAEHSELDAVVELGDYIYEYAHNGYVGRAGALRTAQPLNTVAHLNDYRQRFATHRTDADLQEAHRKFPWICTLDDHEYADNAYANGATGDDPNIPARDGTWAQRKRAALQAYTEWIPLRWSGDLSNPKFYRTLRFGTLAEISMLDLRTYRTEQADVFSRQIDSDVATITGKAQLDWLIASLASSTTRWQLVGNPVMMAPFMFPPFDTATVGAIAEMLGLPKEGVVVNTDQWDGYSHDREKLFAAIEKNRVRNPVFVTGDIHSSWANELPIDAGRYPDTANAGVEFVVPSVTANSLAESIGVPDRTAAVPAEQAIRAVNRHVRWNQMDQHGFLILEVTPGSAVASWHLLDSVITTDSRDRVAARWRVRDRSRHIESV